MGEIVNCYNFTQLFSRAWTQAMSPSNIMSGFRCTGICPFDRSAIKVPGGEMSSDDEGVVDLGEKTGLKYIPLFSPAPKRKERQPSSPTFPSLSFTEEENSRFQLRWENGYDQQYNDWVKIHHPDSPKSGGLDLTLFPGYSLDEEPAAILLRPLVRALVSLLMLQFC